MNLRFLKPIVPVLVVLASLVGCSSSPTKPPEATVPIVKDDRAWTP